MKHAKLCRFFCLFLCLLFLAGCAPGGDGAENKDEGGDFSPSEPSQGAGNSPAAADEQFALNYSDSYSLNPITGTNPYNMIVASLMYEGLFDVGDDFSYTPVLCDSFSTDNGKNYTFTILSGVKLSDGSDLTAEDVVYSIGQARVSEKYKSRFGDLAGISTVDSTTFAVTLSEANYHFPLLLDIPIIAAGSINERVPAGTGPYTFTASEAGAYLSLRPDYRSDLTVPEHIDLTLSTNSLVQDFSFGALDLISFDPTGESDIVNIHIAYDRYLYNTSTLHYIGFNRKSTMMSNDGFRKAISCAIDRRTIVKSAFNSLATEAPLVFNPAAAYYPKALESLSEFSAKNASSLFTGLGMGDTDQDGYLEYAPTGGSVTKVSIDFIVNEESAAKVAAAQIITDELQGFGINITLRTLPWDEYTKALAKGNFDMYYGEVNLSPDFDLSLLVLPGGALDYGGMGSEDYASVLANFKAASTEEGKAEAARALCQYLYEHAPIAPVLYKQYAAIVHQGAIQGFSPAQGNLFHNLSDLKFHVQ